MLAYGAKPPFDLAAPFGLVSRECTIRVPSEAAIRASCGERVDLRIVNVETNGDTAGGDGVAQTVERGIESLAGIKLRMGMSRLASSIAA